MSGFVWYDEKRGDSNDREPAVQNYLPSDGKGTGHCTGAGGEVWGVGADDLPGYW